MILIYSITNRATDSKFDAFERLLTSLQNETNLEYVATFVYEQCIVENSDIEACADLSTYTVIPYNHFHTWNVKEFASFLEKSMGRLSSSRLAYSTTSLAVLKTFPR